MQPTREEILKEPAGPRLNAWVAEFIMGLNVVEESDFTVPIIRDGTGQGFLIADYSQNIGHAWEVLEKIQDLHKGVEFRNAWWIITPFDFTQFTAKTMSLFISRAALLAKLEDK